MNRTEELNEALRSLGGIAAASGSVQIPPNFVATLGMTVTEFDEKHLVAEFPIDRHFDNPLGAYLGGMLCAVADAACGPLSFLACGKPAVTTEFSMTYLRPVTKRDSTVTVRAEVVSVSRTLVVMEASVFNPRGKVVARARTTSFVIDRRTDDSSR